MKWAVFILICAVFVFTSPASAQSSGQEIHILQDGQIHLVGAELVSKHALNLYTVRSWSIKWLVPVELGDAKLESAYGAKIDAYELKEGDYLEIKGKFIITKSYEFKIEPTLIRDLSIKTGMPPTAPTSLPQIASPTSNLPLPTSKLKLTMTLKHGFWGGQVKILQEFLKKEGHFPKSEPTSRYFGPATKKALSDFQTANALEATGALGPKTRALINSLLAQ